MKWKPLTVPPRATSEVIIKKNEMVGWDRGFNTGKEQVWGAEKGSYTFKKTKIILPAEYNSL
ncbi:MAG: hypothetical protein JSW33_05800 [bacterium]|nr:MAG: hypothetical protein JSW33_05800 [bacterium]